MPNAMRFPLVAIAITALLGCGRQEQKSDTTPADFQRFVVVNGQREDIAFDTKTGTLCKTWAEASGIEGAALSTCFDLYNTYK